MAICLNPNNLLDLRRQFVSLSNPPLE